MRFSVGQDVKYRSKPGKVAEEWWDGEEWRYYVDSAKERYSVPARALQPLYRRGETPIKSDSDSFTLAYRSVSSKGKGVGA